MKFHLRIRSHTCQECGKSFIEKSHLVRHEKIHSDQKLKCEECEYTTTRNDKLKDHVSRHHSEEARLKKQKREAAKVKPAPVQSQEPKTTTSSVSNTSTPYVVNRWDHGVYTSYVIPPNEDQSSGFQGGNLIEDNYCVLRDQLTSNEPLPQPLIQAVMPDGQLSSHSQLTDISNCQPELDHAGTLQQDAGPGMELVSSPGQMDHVSTSGITTGLDVNNMHESHSYTTINSATTISQQQAAEYGGLSAFMALF